MGQTYLLVVELILGLSRSTRLINKRKMWIRLTFEITFMPLVARMCDATDLGVQAVKQHRVTACWQLICLRNTAEMGTSQRMAENGFRELVWVRRLLLRPVASEMLCWIKKPDLCFIDSQCNRINGLETKLTLKKNVKTFQ